MVVAEPALVTDGETDGQTWQKLVLYEWVHTEVNFRDLFVDQMPPNGDGYARPLNHGRLEKLRREWDPNAFGTILISDRGPRAPKGRRYAILDGQHRVEVGSEKGMRKGSAKVYRGLSRRDEARLYTLFGTYLPQTPAVKFSARLMSDSPQGKAAREIIKTLHDVGLEIDLSPNQGSFQNGKVRAIATLDSIYARGQSYGLFATIKLLYDAFGTDPEGFSHQMLEGTWQFIQRYAYGENRRKFKRQRLIDVLRKQGVRKLVQASDSLFFSTRKKRVLTIGRVMLEAYNMRLDERNQLPQWQDRFYPEGHPMSREAQKRRRTRAVTAPRGNGIESRVVARR